MRKLGGAPKCLICQKPVYINDLITAKEQTVHKACFKCATCKKNLTVELCGLHENQFYCNPHLKAFTTPTKPKPAATTAAAPAPASARAPAPVAHAAPAPASARATPAPAPSTTTTPAPKPVAPAPPAQGNPPPESDRAKAVEAMKRKINDAKMQAAAMPVQAPSLCRRVFTKYDEDGDGSITIADLQKMCMEMGQHLSEDELTMAIRLIDTDGSGTIEFPEFEKWWRQESRFAKLQMDESKMAFLHAAFERFISFDADASGTICREEFPQLHEFLFKHNYTTQPLDTAWEQMDTDRSDTISFNEYVDYLLYCRDVLSCEGKDSIESVEGGEGGEGGETY